MRLLILRHGQTDWNIVKKLQGQSDIELNENGIASAIKVHDALLTTKIDYCFSSPLKRARKTAELVLDGRNIEIVTDVRLTEIGFGINEGRLPNERTEGTNLFFQAPELYEAKYGAESIEALKERIGSFINDKLVSLSKLRPEATVLISGHGALDKGFYSVLMNKEIKDFWSGNLLENLYIAEFDIDGTVFRLIKDFFNPITEPVI